VNHGTLSHGKALLWMLGAIRNGISSDDRYSSSRSKTLRAAMGYSFRSTGCVKRAKECWNESHTINGSAPAAKTKEKRGGLNRRLAFHRPRCWPVSTPWWPNLNCSGYFGSCPEVHRRGRTSVFNVRNLVSDEMRWRVPRLYCRHRWAFHGYEPLICMEMTPNAIKLAESPGYRRNFSGTTPRGAGPFTGDSPKPGKWPCVMR
jgi:hypothetical protein